MRVHEKCSNVMSIMSDTHCRLYLILPQNGEAELAGRLGEALSDGSVACVLLQTDGGRLEGTDKAARFKEVAHHHDAAFLIEDDADAARSIGADGVHLSLERTADESSYPSARQVLGDDAIVGVNCGASRHLALLLAEQGADYVAFSEPAAGVSAGVGVDSESANELISWWSEFVEVPSVAWQIISREDAETAARQGADFVALDAAIWRDRSTASETIRAIQDGLSAVKLKA